MAESAQPKRTVIRLMALIEAATVTGPAKNLLEFCRRARAASPGLPAMPAVDTTVVTFHRGNPAQTAFVAAARNAGIEVEAIHERFRFDPAVVSQLRRMVRRRTPDILQTHNVKSHFLAKLTGAGRERPWIAFHHGYTTTDLKMRIYNQLNRWSLPGADRVVTVCKAFARDLVREGVCPERISIVHNSVAPRSAPDESAVAELRAELRITPGVRTVLSVGRFSREKGQTDLIEAFSLLRQRNQDLRLRLVLVGEGPERVRVERAAAAAGIEAQVVFAGQRSDVAPFYALADVLALPSHSEGSPNVLLEAMAAGLPVAGTNVGGIAEIVTDEESALLVPPRAPDRMAAALARLLSDQKLAARLASRAKELVITRHSPEAHHRALLELYGSILAGMRRG